MIRFMTTLVLAGTAISLAQAATAQEASAPNKAQAMFAQVDTNHDTVISLEEWKAAGRRERGYAMVDADRDGKVTIDELRAAAAKRGR
jgi:Ca2+-binding EF-hand superfamily protein